MVNCKRDRVCLFYQISTSCGGAERRLMRIFANIFPDDRKSRVSIIVKDNGIAAELRNDLNRWSGGKVEFVRSYFELFHLFLTRRYRWVCAASLGYSTALIFLCAVLCGTKRLFASVQHEASLLSFKSFKSRLRFMTIAHISTAIDCLYPNALGILQARFSRKTVTLTPGSFTDMDEFTPKKKQNSIVFASRLIQGKGLEMFLEAVRTLKSHIEIDGYQVLVCGTGPMLDNAKVYICENEMQHIVRFMGQVNMADIFPETAIFCSLQTPTNYPSQALIEAMASGCFCIVSNTGESSMMITDEFGELIENSTRALEVALKNAMEHNESDRDSIAIEARKFVIKHYMLDRSVAHYERLFGE